MESSRLKRLLELTRRVERARKGELMAAHADLTSAEAAQRAAELAEAQRVRALVEGGDASLHEVERRADMVRLARDHVCASDKQRQEHAANVTIREEERLVATRDVRKMEILWERDREETKRAMRGREQRFADDTRRRRERGG